jgi:hypothetical protein
VKSGVLLEGRAGEAEELAADDDAKIIDAADADAAELTAWL